MELKKMYEAIAFSPVASLSKNIGADDTTIYVDNAAVFPAGPGLATIGIDEGAETIRYAAITDAALTGCMRGIEGTAKAWPAGENIARNFTAKEWNDLKENVEALYKELLDKCVPADWSMNAEDSASHIKNRTHWKEYVAPDLVYLNVSINFKSNMASASGTGLSEIVAGKTYIVYWKGAPYECSAYTSNGEVFLGNGTLMSVAGAENTVEPFCINIFSNTTAYVAKSTDTAETVSLKITPTGKEIYHKLSKNYLPEDIVYGSGSGSGSGGGVSSWNDLTDKPFGDEETVIAAEKTFSSSDGNNQFTDLNSTMVHDGQELVVYFDGVRYTCKVKDWGDDIGLATDNYADMLTGTSELPFCLIFKSTQTNISVTSSGEHTASVYVAETVRMDGKYLPDGLPYTEASGERVEILPETQLLFIEDMDGFSITQELSLAVGETYFVTYNGVGYRTVAQEQIDESMGAAIVLGNFGAMTGGEDTGEPFVVAYAPNVYVDMGMSGFLMAIDGATSVTLAIYQGGDETIHKMDNKYLDLAWLPTIDKKLVDIVEEQEFTVASSGNVIQISDNYAFDLVLGEEYKVVYNGTEYECIAKSLPYDEGLYVYYIGNAGMRLEAEDTGEPFLYVVITDGTGSMQRSFYSVDANASVTIGIKGYQYAPNKLPKEFLPDDIVFDVNPADMTVNCEQYSASDFYNEFSSLVDKNFVLSIVYDDTIMKSKAVYVGKQNNIIVLAFTAPQITVLDSGLISGVEQTITVISCDGTGFRVQSF